MDAGQVGWDPITICYQPPWQERLFFLYFLFVLGFLFVRTVSLARQMGFFSFRRSIASKSSLGGAEQVNALAAMAMTNRTPSELEQFASVNGVQEENRVAASSKILKQADARFRYLWDICMAKVAEMKRLAILTIIIGLFFLTDQTANTMNMIARERYTGFDIFAGSFAELLVPVGLALLSCALLYGISGFLKGRLERRMAAWNYFRVKISDQDF